MEFLPLVLLLAATGLAIAAAALMTRGDGAAEVPHPDRTAPEERGAVAALVLASLAVALGTMGAAGLSSGEVSISGLGPFLLPVLVVLIPLTAAAGRARRRTGRRRRAGRRG